MRKFVKFHSILRFARRSIWYGLKEGLWEFLRIILKDCKKFGPPSKTFSIYRELRAQNPAYSGKVIIEDQGTPYVKQDSVVIKSRLRQHLEQPWPVVWSEHTDQRLISHSLALINEDKELCIESVYGYERFRDDPASKYLVWEKEIYLPGKWTSIVSNWNPLDGVPIYGHWLHDALPRLAYLDELPLDTRILVPNELKPIHWEALELLGLKYRCRPTKETNIVVEKYYFSSPTSMITCYNPYGINWMREKLLPKADKSFNGPKKFFFARTGKNRSIGNIAEITSEIQNMGWDIVNDLDLNFSQTIKLFSEATHVCGFLGSNMSNVIFCRAGCKVTTLVLDFWPDGFVDLIADPLNLDHKSVVLPAGGPFVHTPIVKAADVVSALKK
jgi:hypothetical protein